MGAKRFFKLHRLFSGQFGFAPRVMLNAMRELPRYIREWRLFRKSYRGPMQFAPCLHDRLEEGGSIKHEYFWQDLLVARWIFDANPKRHVDVGSRVDGFVAHIASFRNIDVIDIRPIESLVPGITFKQLDIMNCGSLANDEEWLCDSLSCLHALEHFGLGRYGDPIDPFGYIKGLNNLASMLIPGGTLYLSIPIGHECVEFNAHRIFDPVQFVDLAAGLGLNCQRLSVITAGSHVDHGPASKNRLEALRMFDYSLGIFKFTRNAV